MFSAFTPARSAGGGAGRSTRLRGRLVIWVGLLLTLVAVTVIGGWWAVAKWRKKPPPDMVKVLQINNRGVGHMERFEYREAEAAFQEAVDLAPDWLPARINLGIAIMNEEEGSPAVIERAAELFRQILQKHADNPYAHFCLGICFEQQGKPWEAAPHFKQVTQIDPNDPAAWYHLGMALFGRSQMSEADAPEEAKKDRAEAERCLKQALKLDPYEHRALYTLADLAPPDLEKREALLKAWQPFEKTEWHSGKKNRYSEMGHYAEVIDRPPDWTPAQPIGPLPLFKRNERLQIKLRPGAKWATSADFGKGASAELRRRLRSRFGATMVVLDYNRDGKLDLLMLGAVVKDGQVCDLLLRNDGEGRFTDVTDEAGLEGARPSLGCCVGDFDNDGYPDLFITGIGEQHLFRNTGKGRFEDVTKKAGLDELKTVCLGAAWLDLDQDGDLDLVVAQYAATPEDALKLLQDTKPPPAGAGLAVFLNVGEAVAVNKSVDPPPLSIRFKRADGPAGLLGEPVAATGIAVTDVDADHDLDLVVLADHMAPAVVLNDRLLRFHRSAFSPSLVSPAQWNGALVFDANHHGRSDLFLVRWGRPPLLLLNQSAPGRTETDKSFEKGFTDSPPLLHAQAIDIDLDGWTDIIGLSEEGKPVLLHNDGHRLVYAREKLGGEADWPRDLVAVAVADIDNDGFPDLLLWSESEGLRVHVNLGNGNHSAQLEVTGHRHIGSGGEPMRTNADGVGTLVIVQAQDHWTSAENTTLSAGLGQSRQPLTLGLGEHLEPDVVRLRWSDIVWQAKFNLPTGQGRVVRVDEDNLKPTSCPVLFTWNGQRFEFVTDFLGAGSMGEMQPDGNCRLPRPEESVKIQAQQLVPLDGYYVLKVAQPMDEVVYLDRLQLIVLDHPGDVHVYPDERFVSSGPPASQDLLAFRQQIFPSKARDHRGRDVTQTLRSWDRQTVDDFARRAWLGYAEEHWTELDFGDRLAQFGPRDPLVMCMAGWTDYPYPESIWAATQAGVALQPPVLERLGPDGKWQTVVADAGFPAGLPRMMTLDVTGKLGGPKCVVRLRTNMQVYWDQIFVAPLLERTPASTISKGGKTFGIYRATPLEVSEAILEARGCPLEFSPDGRKPTIYDYDRLSSVPVSRLSGMLTRTGTVTELLRDRDDQFVIFGPGDQITVRFDARRLPKLPNGWKRSFVLRIWGYSKDCGPFTATGDTIEPLPFHGMSKYPYGPDEHYPRDRRHDEYRQRYNTRQVGTVPLVNPAR